VHQQEQVGTPTRWDTDVSCWTQACHAAVQSVRRSCDVLKRVGKAFAISRIHLERAVMSVSSAGNLSTGNVKVAR
jgi:hypothetical protein